MKSVDVADKEQSKEHRHSSQVANECEPRELESHLVYTAENKWDSGPHFLSLREEKMSPE